MTDSARRADVVPIQLLPHNNADSLSLVKVNDFQCVVNTQQWQGHTTAVYIEPETWVDTTREEFAFLKREGHDRERLRAKKLRGEWSIGLLVPTPPGFNIGDDCWAHFGLEHYEPDEGGGIVSGEAAEAPQFWREVGKYDVDNYRNYASCFEDGELVGVTEKMHGTNWAGVYSDGAYHVRSRGFWRKHDGNDYSKVLTCHPELEKFLRDNPNYLACGEMVGRIQKGFAYGIPTGEIRLRLFDIRKPDYKFMDVMNFQDTVNVHGLSMVSIVGGAPLIAHSREEIFRLAEGDTLVVGAKHMREGVVVRPRFERRMNHGGRLILKCVSNKYLEKS